MISYDYSADLRHLYEALGARVVAKPVLSNSASSMNDDVVPDDRMNDRRPSTN